MSKAPLDREQWLLKCLENFRRDFQNFGHPLPERIRASCSWPSKGALAKKKRRIGEAWSAECSGDKTFETFISPCLQDSVEVGATLVHELVHCAVGLKAGHGRMFRECAIKMGLEGKMTATKAGEKLKERLHAIAKRLGEYPHAKLKHSDAPPKQGTRMILVKCPVCEYQCRTTRKWLEVGVPTCPCGTEMIEEGGE